MATLNVGRDGLVGKSFKTLQEAVNEAIDGDIIQINRPKIVLENPIQNFQSGVRIQGNPKKRPVEIFTPKRNVGFYLGSGQMGMEFANLIFIVPEQANGITVSQGGEISFENTTMIHAGNLDERVIRPSLGFSMGNNSQGGSVSLRNSAIDIVSFLGTKFTMQSSNVGNILASDTFSSRTVSVITAPIVQIKESGVQHVGFMPSFGQGTEPFSQPMNMSESYIGANTIIQRSAMLNQMVMTPVVAVNQQQRFIHYPANRGYMPGLIVTGKDAQVTLDQVSIFAKFNKDDIKKSVFANNYHTVLSVVQNMVPFAPFTVMNDGKLAVKNSQIPLTDANNIIQSGQLTLDRVTDQSMWQTGESDQIKLINHHSSSSLFQTAQQDDVMGDGSNNKNGTASEQLHQMIGLKPVKAFYDKFVARMALQKKRQDMGLASKGDKIQSMHAVFSGDAGVGKTSVAKLFGQGLYEAGVLPTPNIKKVSAADLVSNHVGETQKNVKRIIHDAFGGVLFIDEAYSLAPDENGGGNTFKNEAVDELVNEADEYRDKLMIIMAGYTNQMVDFFKRGNPGLRSRFSNWVQFPPYSISELKQIMYLMLKQSNVIIADAQTRQALEHGIDVLVGKQGEASGQGRFVRNYVDKVTGARDVRLMDEINDPNKKLSKQDLLTVVPADAVSATKEMMEQESVFR